jgi:hypothetical protein
MQLFAERIQFQRMGRWRHRQLLYSGPRTSLGAISAGSCITGTLGNSGSSPRDALYIPILIPLFTVTP